MAALPTPTNAAQWYPQATAQWSPSNQSNLEPINLMHPNNQNSSPGSSLATASPYPAAQLGMGIASAVGAPTSYVGNINCATPSNWPGNSVSSLTNAAAARMAVSPTPLGYSVMNMNANSGATVAAAANTMNNNNNDATTAVLMGGGALPRYPANAVVDDTGCCCVNNQPKDVVDDGSCGCCGGGPSSPAGAGCCRNDPNVFNGGVPPLPDTTSCCLLPGEPVDPYICTTLQNADQTCCCECFHGWCDWTFLLMWIFFVATAVGFGLVVGVQRMDNLFKKFNVSNTVALQASLMPYMNTNINPNVCTVPRQLLGAFGTICLENNLNANVMTVQLSAWNNARDTLWFLALVFSGFAVIYAVLISYHRNELRCRLQQQIPPLSPEKQAEMAKLPPAQQHAFLAEYERAAVASAEAMSMSNLAHTCCDYVFPIEVYSTPFYEFMRFAWFISGLVVFVWTCNLTVSFWSVSAFYINNTSGPLRDFWSGFQKKFTATVVVVTIYLAWPFLLFFVELIVWLVLLLPWLLIRWSCKAGIGYYRPALPPHKLPGWIRIDMFFMDLQEIRRLGFSWLSWILLTGSDRPFIDCCADPAVDRDPIMASLRRQHELWQQHLNVMRSIWAMKPGTEMWQRMSCNSNGMIPMSNTNMNMNNMMGNNSAPLMNAAMMTPGYGGSVMPMSTQQAVGGVSANANYNTAMQQIIMGQNGSLSGNPSVHSGMDGNTAMLALGAACAPTSGGNMSNANNISGVSGALSTNPHTPMDDAGIANAGHNNYNNTNNFNNKNNNISQDCNSGTPETRHRHRRHHNKHHSKSKERGHHRHRSPSKEKVSSTPTAAAALDTGSLRMSPNTQSLEAVHGQSGGNTNNNNNMYNSGASDVNAHANNHAPGSLDRHSRSRHHHHRHRDESSRNRDHNRDRDMRELDALMDL